MPAVQGPMGKQQGGQGAEGTRGHCGQEAFLQFPWGSQGTVGRLRAGQAESSQRALGVFAVSASPGPGPGSLGQVESSLEHEGLTKAEGLCTAPLCLKSALMASLLLFPEIGEPWEGESLQGQKGPR